MMNDDDLMATQDYKDKNRLHRVDCVKRDKASEREREYGSIKSHPHHIRMTLLAACMKFFQLVNVDNDDSISEN